MNGYNVYDFDGTIYAGDSSIDFFLFALRRHPAALLTVPMFLWYTVLYMLKKCTKEQMKEQFFSFLRYVPDIELEVDQFWIHHARKIYPWYIEQVHSSDIIISASPEFLLTPIMSSYHIIRVIGTRIDEKSGKIFGENCSGEQKVVRFKELFKAANIAKFFSDTDSDLPLARLAKTAYIVRNGEVHLWNC